MKRTYFVPICVLAGFFLLAGFACVIMTTMLSGTLDKLDAAFESRFKPPGVYHLLYHEALECRLELSRHQKESGGIITSFVTLQPSEVPGSGKDGNEPVRM